MTEYNFCCFLHHSASFLLSFVNLLEMEHSVVTVTFQGHMVFRKMLWFRYFTYKRGMDLRHEFALYQWYFLLSFNLIMDTIYSRYTRCFKGHGGWGKENGRHPARKETIFFCMKHFFYRTRELYIADFSVFVKVIYMICPGIEVGIKGINCGHKKNFAFVKQSRVTTPHILHY